MWTAYVLTSFSNILNKCAKKLDNIILLWGITKSRATCCPSVYSQGVLLILSYSCHDCRIDLRAVKLASGAHVDLFMDGFGLLI